MSRPNAKGVMTGSAQEAAEPIDWEMRPGGMLVQKRDPDAAVATGPLIKIKVSHGLFGHDVSVSAHATFGAFTFYLSTYLYCVRLYADFLSWNYEWRSSVMLYIFPKLCLLQVQIINNALRSRYFSVTST